MSQRRGSRRGSDWKPPRDRREIVIAVLASLSVIVVTVALLWFLRPGRNSGSTSTTVPSAPTSTTVAGETTTAVPTTTVAPTTAPATTSTP